MVQGEFAMEKSFFDFHRSLIQHCKILLLLKEGPLQLRIFRFAASFSALRREGQCDCEAFLHLLAGIEAACCAGQDALFRAAFHTDECINPSDMVKNIIQWVIGIAGVVSAIFVVYGGIAYATSSGDPSKIQKAKSTIIYALIGLAVVALAEIITAFVSNMIRESNKTSQINQTIISKEVYEIKTS